MTTVKFTDNRMHEGSYVVYLNGIEVPVQSVSVSMGINYNPTASLVVVPDPLISRIGAEDRMEVAVFYLDDTYPSVEKPGRPADFRLLYDGDITSWSYANSPMGRRIGLGSQGPLKILQDLYPYFITGPLALTMEVAGAPQGNEQSYVTNAMNFPWNRFFFGFDQEKETLIRRPYDMIENILNSCIGEEEQKKLGSVTTINFYARYMKRMKFVNRFAPSPLIETDILQAEGDAGVFPILRAVRDDKVIESLVRGASQAGAGAPIWGTVQQMFLQMYYEMLALPTAAIAQMDRTEGSPNNGVILGPPKFGIPIDDARALEANEKELERIDQEITAAILDAELELREHCYDDIEFSFLLADKEREIRRAYNSVSMQQPEDPAKPNILLNYVTKPQWLFGIIPACNVVFPSMIQEIAFSENYADQPTRLYLNDMWYSSFTAGGNPIQDALTTLRAGYPPQVQSELDKRYGKSDTSFHGDVKISGKNLLVWPEEFFKGPVPENINLPNWFTLLAQYVQAKQTVEQKNAAAALAKLKSVSDSGGDVAGTISRMMSEGLIGALIEGDYKNAFQQVSETLRAQANEQNIALDVLRKGYARYEYYRNRAKFRSGSVVTTFNPYMVPGFPTIVFDTLSSGHHFIGYVSEITHTMTKETKDTQFTFTYGQTLDEFLQEVFDARVGNTPFGVLSDQGAAPVNPINALRDVTQVQERAEDYFSLLFHQRGTYGGVKTAAFNFDEVIRLLLPDGSAYRFSDAITPDSVQSEVARRLAKEKKETDEIEKKVADYSVGITEEVNKAWANVTEWDSAISIAVTKNQIVTDKVNRYRQQLNDDLTSKRAQEALLTPKKIVPSDLLQRYVDIAPAPAYAEMFRSHDNAMRYVSRPICTLDEYIAFRGRFGTKYGLVSATDTLQGKGGRYYEKILNLRQGPGTPPTFDENNNLLTPKMEDLPDTRFDWETRLWAYRRKVLFNRVNRRQDEEG